MSNPGHISYRTVTPASKKIKTLKDRISQIKAELRLEIHHREQTSETLEIFMQSNKKLRRTMMTVRMRAGQSALVALSLEDSKLYHDLFDMIEIINDELGDSFDIVRQAVISKNTNRKKHGTCGRCGELDCGGECI